MAPATFGTPISIQGVQGDIGPIGPQGYSILAGNGSPADDLGTAGDIYVDLTVGNLYAPKTASGWPTATRSLIGPKGAKGAIGAAGAALLNGYGPPDDSLGSDGDSYFDSQRGAIFGPKSMGHWPEDASSLIGPPGGIGETGTIIYSADGPPSNSQGRDNDFYIDTMSSGLYGPKLKGDWGNALSLIGPRGLKGDQGLRGLAGLDGATIIVGSGSPDGGKQGDVFIDAVGSVIYGPRGADGPQPWPAKGYSYRGLQGEPGPQGVAGMVGSDGKTLLAGPTDPTDQGVDGDFYFQTTSGILYGPRANGAYPEHGFLLKGPPGDVGPKGDVGAQGVQGPGILTGSGAPASSLGTVGSFYVDGKNYVVYGPKSDAELNPWGTGTALVGPTGAKGADSTVPGPQGPMGFRGFSVQSGQGAPPSTLGNDGDLYVDLSVPALYAAKANGAWPPQSITLTGPKGDVGAQSTVPGPAGPKGYSLLTGAGAPSSTYGSDGDAYIDINAANLYGAKSSGVWPTTYVALIGATGPQGPQGIAGTAGTILRYGQGAPGAQTTASNGDFYIDQTNSRLYGPRTAGSFGSSFVSLVGPIGLQGPPGVAGNIIASGTGAPDASVGNPGDYYIANDTGRLYGPKKSSGWDTSYVTLSSAVPNDIKANSIVIAPVSGDTAPVQIALNSASGNNFLADAAGNVTAAGTLKVSGVSTLAATNATTLSSSGATTANSLQVSTSANIAGTTGSGRFVANSPGSAGSPILSYTSNTGNLTGIYSDGNFGSYYELVNGFLTRQSRYIQGPPADQGAGFLTHLTYSGVSGAANVAYRWHTASGVALAIFGDLSATLANNLSVAGLTTTGGLKLSGGSVTFADNTTLSTANIANQTTYKATSTGTVAAPAFTYTGATAGAGLYFDGSGNVFLSVNGYKSLFSTAAAGAAAGANGWAIASTLATGQLVFAVYGGGNTTTPVASVDGAGLIKSTGLTLTGGALTFADGTSMTTAASGTGGSSGGSTGSTPSTGGATGQVRYGKGPPTSGNPAVQADGDSYIDTVQSFLYGPRANGVWPSPGISLIGPTGPTGPVGPAGTVTRSWIYAGTFWNTSTAANSVNPMVSTVQSGSTVGQTPAVAGMVRAGSVTGYSFNQVGPVTGSYTLTIQKNGTTFATFSNIGSGISSTKPFTGSVAAGTYPFAAGDGLVLSVQTSGSGNMQSFGHIEITTA